ncbi:MAG: SIS domain-containing protein [Chloroflexi bacterium HGW-Chloroflexi-10]|nr:MAG: SIS domain-containing protein [Chloroflexi bacterium HGW-Chloroflexi-10]
MSAELYIEKISNLVTGLNETSLKSIKEAANAMANSIKAGRPVYYYGSGHSALPCLDVYPRYGTFVGIQPIHDPRLTWTNVLGPGGTPELLWLERQEGYVKNVFRSYDIQPQDTLIVFSHGGLNAAGIEAALLGKENGATVVAITSMQNYHKNAPKHSSGKKLADVADIVIDNASPPEDSLISIPNWEEPVAAASTVMGVVISMTLIAETAKILSDQGVYRATFASPNVVSDPDHDLKVYEEYKKFHKSISGY